ncbi:MAG: hypothetical protein FWD22_05755 [Treponema sp.]|nr:hypothetical protein [Treponema sp.]
MFFCTSCGVKNEVDSNFCRACGKPAQGGTVSQANTPPPAPKTDKTLVNKCTACGAIIESFRTSCSSCGIELVTNRDVESVKGFFKKLEDITEREYEANKQRERESKLIKMQSTPMVICEAIAVASLILLVMKLTGISETILDYIKMFFLE